MQIESGEFICPNCGKNGMSNYLNGNAKKKIDEYSIKKIKVRNIKLIFIEIMMIMNF